MLSVQSKLGIAQAFERAARAGLVRQAGDVIEIVHAERAGPANRAGHCILVITASSFVFRLMTIFYLEASPESREYYCGKDATDERLKEVFPEIVNLCGGALNRELSRHFPHLAMSVPHGLSAECLDYVEQLKAQHLAGCSITINQSVRLTVMLCMTCSAPVHIPANASLVEETSGELELF